MKCETFRFDEVTINFDRNRVPLSTKQRLGCQGDYPYYGAQGVIDHINDYIFDGTYLLIAEDGENLKSKKQNIAQLAKGKFWVNNHAHVVRTNERCELSYLYYLINSMDLSGYITGSVQPKLSQTNLNAVLLQLPSVPEQKKIVSILSSLDDKIELNNKLNANLEQQAQALFKAWFVDFEPFGGSKPRTWVETDIYQLANVIYGAPFKSAQFNTKGIGTPIIRIRDLKEQQFATYTTEVHPKGYLLRPGDLVVGMDGEFRPYIWGNGEAWLNQRVCVFEPKRPKGKVFLYCLIKPLLFACERMQVATTVIHIGKKDFDTFRFTLPTEDVLEMFDALTTPLYDMIVSNKQENRRLAEIRDALLPHLLARGTQTLRQRN